MNDRVYWVNSASIVRRHDIFPLAYADVPIHSQPDDMPTISLMLPYDGERDGRPFRCDCLDALDYPRSRLSVFIISDGADEDKLAAIEHRVRRLSSQGMKIELVRHRRYRGQIAVLDEAIAADSSDIVVLSDLMTPLQPGTLRKVAKVHLDGIGLSPQGPRL